MDQSRRLLRTGMIGTLITALCCFTPVLVILLGAVGLSALTGSLDVVLFPALLFFMALMGYARYRNRNDRKACNTLGKTGDSQ